MIRERGSRAYYGGSVGYHGVAVAPAALLNPWLAAPFAVYLLRAAVLPGRGLKVGVVGALEVLCSLALLGTVLAAF